ncbi:MAG: hypothetical protein Kow0099_21690 [Candidatus Abyssubacteria bacterium]
MKTISFASKLAVLFGSLCICGACAGSSPSSKNVLLRIDGDTAKDRALGRHLASFSDIDGDDFPEIVAVSPSSGLGSIVVYSGASGQMIYRIEGVSNEYSLKCFSPIADLNGDGIQEIAVPHTGFIVFSGKDGSLLYKSEEKLHLDRFEPPRLLALPDRNGDGVVELALDQPRRGLIVLSGKDGTRLGESAPLGNDEEHMLYSQAPDLDADGLPDLLGFQYTKRLKGQAGLIPVPLARYFSSADLRPIGEPFELPIDQRPGLHACADLNRDGTFDVVIAHHSGGLPQGSLLVAVSGSDQSELWRVNGADAEYGSRIIGVSAKTGEIVSDYTDIQFGDALALIPDCNGDGIEDIVTAHPTLYSKELGRGGCVCVFSGSDGTLLKTIFSPDKENRISAAIAPFTDCNFDGAADLLVGIPSATVGGVREVGAIIVLPL